ncbi:hypothetical protein DL89DRAFT_314213 [Linderina pennispora]|uniref:Uncharacterized protein n=1 Tax=Linderina pennispora TaxID=61395 RepID=A0A1Y1VWS0_9FUNG|nr:uncharacterized protein DL89DRAFT_314213 [Linderina pennispora]ORX65194.1 hypothetical protein DL89DRAFT_314213 [Linderina pennispora]
MKNITMFSDVTDYWSDNDYVQLIDISNKKSITELANMIPCDNTIPFFGVEFAYNRKIRFFDKNTLQEFNCPNPWWLFEIVNIDEDNYKLIRDTSKCVSVGGIPNKGSDVLVVTYKRSLEDDSVKDVIEETQWVLVMEDGSDQVEGGLNVIRKLGHMSTGTDLFVIANGDDDYWIVDASLMPGEPEGCKVKVSQYNAKYAVIICGPFEISFDLAVKNLRRYNSVGFD